LSNAPENAEEVGLRCDVQDALKNLGLRIKFDEKGESEVYEKEGAQVIDVSCKKG